MTKFKKNLREKFSFQLAVRLGAYILVTTVVFTGIFIFYQRDSVNKSLIKEGKALAQMVASNARLGVFAENDTLIENNIRDFFLHRGIEAIDVFNLDAKPLLHLEMKDGKVIRGKTKLTKRQLYDLKDGSVTSIDRYYAPVVADKSEGGLELYFSPEETKQEPIGSIVVYYNRTELLKTQQGIILYNAVFVSLIIMFIAYLAAFPLIRQTVKPLQRLTNAVEEIKTKGNITALLPVERNDEIGKLTEAFNSMSANLIRKDIERTQYETQLRESQKMEAIGLLSGGLAHDFNNLLTAIMAHNGLLSESIDKNSPLQRHIEQIESSANIAASITRNLMTFSRQTIDTRGSLDLVVVVKNMYPLLRTLIEEDIDLKIESPGRELIVVADKSQIEQCVLNLAVNAKDAMSGGGVLTISISEMIADNNESWATLSVSDTGRGIEEDVKNRMFDPFFTTKEEGKGTGLGLSIVHGIVKSYQGHIEVKSQKDQGTTFTIYLPIGTAAPSVQVNADIRPGRGNETLLFVEDNASVRDVFSGILRREGYHVVEAKDGIEAIEKFQSDASLIDMVICDVVMPRGSGKEVFDAVKQISPQTHFIFMTGYSGNMLKQKKAFIYEVEILQKPVTAQQLLIKIREVLDREEADSKLA